MKTVLIIGMGEFGKHLARKLVSLRNEVCIVDSDKNIINVLSNEFENAYTADCMQKVALEELGVKNFDICIVAIGDNFQASLEITSILKELNAKYIISKSSSEIQTKFLLMAGADETIYPEKDIAEKIAVRCNATNLFDYIQISDEYSIFEIRVLNSWVGKTLKELNIRNTFNLNIIAVNNESNVSIPTADYVFKKGDHVFVFGKGKDIKKLNN